MEMTGFCGSNRFLSRGLSLGLIPIASCYGSTFVCDGLEDTTPAPSRIV